MKTCLSILIAVFPIAISNAATHLDSEGSLPAQLSTMPAETDVSFIFDDRDSGAQLLARADQDDNEQHGKAKGHEKGKGKGKAKGHNKDKDGDADEKESQDSAPANPQPGQSPPAKPAPAQPSVAAPAPAAAAPAHATIAKSPAETKAVMEQRLRHISNLDKNTATSKARFATLSQETGVPVSTLQAQHKAHPVGSGGLLIANEMAKATGKPAATFMKERLQGKDWTRIAAEHKFDLTPVLPKLERLQESMEAVSQPPRR